MSNDGVKPFEEKDWENACKAGKAGLKNARLLEALFSLFVSPSLPGGVNRSAMGVQIEKGVWQSARIAKMDLMTQPRSHVAGKIYNNMKEVFDDSCEKHADLPCMGKRDILTVRVEGGLEKYKLGPYSWITYREAHAIAKNFGKGLLKATSLKHGEVINFFADTCREWQLGLQGCFQEGIIVSTTYANLGEEAVAYAIGQTETQVILTDAPLVKTIVVKILKECPRVKYIVYIPDRRPATSSLCVSREDILGVVPPSVKVFSFDEVCDIGAEEEKEKSPDEVTILERVKQTLESPKSEAKKKEITRESICVMMYTSGSTALPKSVLISHGNMLAVVGGSSNAMPDMGPGDVYIGYLPLAHILEMVAEVGSLVSGSCIGYGTPKTLSDAGVCIDPGTCRGDAPELRPTMLAAVPMIFDKIRSAVLAKVKATGGLKAKVFHYALARKILALERGNGAPFWDLLVFDALRKQLLGGRVRYMLSGGGPLSRATQVFMNVVMNCPVGQGFGLTEAVGVCTTVWPNDRSYGRVGAPIECNLIQLQDWEEGGYYVDPSKDPAKGSPNPRGEILVGGANVTMGYYKLEEETKKSYFVDASGMRWFRTGDVGEMFPNGTLQIVDRKKDLVKLSGGEYVSYGKLEPLLRESEYVDNGFIYANPLKSFCVAVITLRPTVKGVPDAKQVLENVTKIFKDNNCLSFEIPKKLYVESSVAWTPESDLVTAALKLKRANLTKHYSEVLDNLYAADLQV